MKQGAAQIAVFGNGVSGQAVARLIQSNGNVPVIFDERIHPLDKEISFDDFIAAVFSPGFAAGHRWRVAAEKAGLPVYGELGYAASLWKGRVFGVTGTNGKTTVTEFLTQILKLHGEQADSAGNIGTPLSQVVLESKGRGVGQIAVCEISSFQAELPRGLKLDGLIWTNFAEDHLDRYASLGEYFSAKAKLVACLKAKAPFIASSDVFERMEENLKEHCIRVSDAPEQRRIFDGLCSKTQFVRPPQSQNLSVVLSFCSQLSISEEVVFKAANQFEFAPCRMEHVACIGKIDFWNDSKATNFHAAEAAIRGFQGTLIWIGGGQSKGGKIRQFVERIAPHLTVAYVYGSVASELTEAFYCLGVGVEKFVLFEDAVKAAIKSARARSATEHGITVLLSPGFASFDQFSSYRKRGKSFEELVLSLKERGMER